MIEFINEAVEADQTALALPELRSTFGGWSLVPDVSVCRWERLLMDECGLIADEFDIHPDWLTAVLRPGQSSTHVVSNLVHCLNHGCEMGWLLDPVERQVQIYRRDGWWRSLAGNDELMFPEFIGGRLELRAVQLFDWLRMR